MPLFGSVKAAPLAVFSDAHLAAHTQGLETLAREGRDEIVDGRVGRCADEDGTGDLEVDFEQSDDLGDCFRFASARGLQEQLSVLNTERECKYTYTLNESETMLQRQGNSCDLNGIQRSQIRIPRHLHQRPLKSMSDSPRPDQRILDKQIRPFRVVFGRQSDEVDKVRAALEERDALVARLIVGPFVHAMLFDVLGFAVDDKGVHGFGHALKDGRVECVVETASQHSNKSLYSKQ